MKLINYPAMASQASISFIDKYLDERLSHKAEIIDPYCGTGRLLISPRRKGHNVTGFDISPIAVLTARVLHQQNNINRIQKDLISIKTGLEETPIITPPSESELFWFPERAYIDLRRLLVSINANSSSENTRRFFWLCLTNVSRIASYIREEEYKTHRIKPKERIKYEPDAINVFFRVCEQILLKVKKNNVIKPGNYRLVNSDVTHAKGVRNTFDALITSPPYGDSKTTVGYGQFASIPLMILSYSRLFTAEFNLKTEKGSLDTFCLGGSNCKTKEIVELPESVQYIDAGPMKKFCLDYFQRLKATTELLSDNAICCLVLADRTYKKKQFPLIESSINYLNNLGFDLIGRHDRFLTWKQLPRTMKHVHENKSVSHTGMNYESVVAFSRSG